MVYICISKWDYHQAIISANAALLPTAPLGTNISEIKNQNIFIQGNAYENVLSKMSAILLNPWWVLFI